MKKTSFLFDRDTLEVNGEIFVSIYPIHTILRKQREALGLTQQQVADAAFIGLRQYQRYESDERHFARASFRIGVNVCRALKLNPFDIA